MGNSASSSGRHHEDTVDFGHLTPQGVYTGPKDWNQPIVSQLICDRKLAPFYRPLEEYEDSWDDDRILSSRKEFPLADTGNPDSSSLSRTDTNNTNGLKSGHHRRPAQSKEPTRSPDAGVYRGAVECPICFLYYPPNINHSRCCDQAICTECFVQIKRTEPTATHIVSEPAACPYCVQDDFGIIYVPPPWRTGIGSGGMNTPPWMDSSKGSEQSIERSSHPPSHKRRLKVFGADSPEVVTTDQIRPDWEAKLASVRAAVTRRANRRIIMRQVGDRLIPVGVSSGRVHAINPEDGQPESIQENGGSRRSRRRQQAAQNQDFNQLLGSMALGGQDLEELMIMEAMRLSLVDHEEHQQREADRRRDENTSANIPSDPSPSASAALRVPEPPPSFPSSLQTVTSSPSRVAGSSSDAVVPLTRQTEGPAATATVSQITIETPSPSLNSITTAQSLNNSNCEINPPLFSTLRAALSAASTASAVLGDSDRSADLPTSERTGGFATVTTGDADISSPAAPTDSMATTAPVSQGTFTTDTESFISQESELRERVSSYDVLLSSPESEFSREPLLGETAPSTEEDSRENSVSEPHFVRHG